MVNKQEGQAEGRRASLQSRLCDLHMAFYCTATLIGPAGLGLGLGLGVGLGLGLAAGI